jgi:hypothetical protein
MRLFVRSGTDIRPIVERYDSAAQALEAVEQLKARRLPNIRIVDAKRGELSLATLRLLAAEENEGDDA